MGKVTCALEKCGNERKSNAKNQRSYSFFGFPKEDDVLQKWLDFVNSHNETKLDKKTLDRRRLRLCHMHFERKDIRSKNGKDRMLLPFSYPTRESGVVVYNATNSPKSKRLKKADSTGKEPQADVVEPTATTKPTENTTTVPEPPKESSDAAPLFHSINGFMVDLRFASQLEMFRLPNGKLIQVRKQAKKGAAAAIIATTTDATPEAEKKDKVDVPEKKDVADAAKGGSADESTKAALSVPVEKVVKKKPEKLIKKVTVPQKPAPIPELGEIVRRAQYKTYINRRSHVAPAAPTPTARVQVPESSHAATRPVEPPMPTRARLTPVTQRPLPPVAPTRPTPPVNPMPIQQASKPRRPIVVPCLTALQTLVFKPHDEITPFDLFQRQFENQLISTAEIALHVVAKINNLVSSNPFKSAETEHDLKYMYHHVGYILKYATDRIRGLSECCASDIKNMGFNEKADLGPVFGAVDEPVEKPKSPVMPEAAAAEPEKKDDDEDCAIVEEHTDMIEIDSDDEEDQPKEDAPKESLIKKPKVEPVQLTRAKAPEESNASGSESEESEDEPSQFIISEVEEPDGVIRQDSETTLKIANVIEQYYGESSSDEEEEEETEETNSEGMKKEVEKSEPMEVDVPEKASEQLKKKAEESESTSDEEDLEDGTTELIEIIDGEEDADDDEPEYGVVEVGDGDFYLVTTDGEEV